MKKLYLLFCVSLLFITSVYAYSIPFDNLLMYNNGTAKNGTYTATYTCRNSSLDTILSDVSSITSNVNGKFKKVLDFPYFGNSSVDCRIQVDSDDTGFQSIGFVPNSINSQYLQGQPITYFASLAQVNALIAANGNWSEVSGNYYTSGDTDILLGNKLNIVDTRYNDTLAIQQVNNTKLNLSDQRYNETSLISSINNQSNSSIAGICSLYNGNWSAVQNSYSTTATVNNLIAANGNWSLDKPSYSTLSATTTNIGNWSADKPSYVTVTSLNSNMSNITTYIATLGNYSAENSTIFKKVGGTITGNTTFNEDINVTKRIFINDTLFLQMNSTHFCLGGC